MNEIEDATILLTQMEEYNGQQQTTTEKKLFINNHKTVITKKQRKHPTMELNLFEKKNDNNLQTNNNT